MSTQGKTSWWDFQNAALEHKSTLSAPHQFLSAFFQFSASKTNRAKIVTDYAHPSSHSDRFVKHVQDLCFPHGCGPFFSPCHDKHYFHHVKITQDSATDSSDDSNTCCALHGTVLTFFETVNLDVEITFDAVIAHEEYKNDFIDFLIDSRAPEVKVAVEFYEVALKFFCGCSGFGPYDATFVNSKLADDLKQTASQVIGSAYEIVDVSALDALVLECVNIAQNEAAYRGACGSALWLRLKVVLQQLFDRMIQDSFQEWKSTMENPPSAKAKMPVALCLLSTHPSSDLMEVILFEIATLLENDTGHSLDLAGVIPFLLDDVPVPPAACQGVVFEIPTSRKVLSFRSEAANSLPAFPVNVAKLLDIVPISALIQMFTTLVFENSIIVFANTVEEASIAILALESLLFPAHWPGAVVPSLPRRASMDTSAMAHDRRPFMLGLDKTSAVRHRSLLSRLLQPCAEGDKGGDLTRRPVALFDISRCGSDSGFVNSTNEYISRLAQSNAHRHILDPKFEYGHQKIEELSTGDEGDPKAWKRMSMTGLHLRDRARRWIGKLKKKAQDAKEARRKKKEAKALAKRQSALLFDTDSTQQNGSSNLNLRHKYPEDLDPHDVNARYGLVAVRKWLGLTALHSSDFPGLAAGEKQSKERSRHPLLPQGIGTLLLNDLRRVQEFVSVSADQVHSGIEADLLQTSFVSCWAATLRAYRSLTPHDMLPGNRHVAARKMAAGSLKVQARTRSGSNSETNTATSAEVAKQVKFFDSLVESKMFSRFLAEFHVPQFCHQEHGQSTAGSSGGSLRLNHIALFDASIDSLNVIDHDRADTQLADDAQDISVHRLPVVDATFAETPAFDFCSDKLIFTSMAKASSHSAPSSPAHAVDDKPGSIAAADDLQSQRREFLERVLSSHRQYRGHTARVFCHPLFQTSSLAFEDGLAVAEARCGALIWAMQRRLLNLYDELSGPVRDTNQRTKMLESFATLFSVNIVQPLVNWKKAASGITQTTANAEASIQLREGVWKPSTRFIADFEESVADMVRSVTSLARRQSENVKPLRQQLELIKDAAERAQRAFEVKFANLLDKRNAHSTVLNGINREDHQTVRWLEESKEIKIVREPYSVYIASWNVNAKVVSEDALVGLEKWITGSQLQGGKGLPDIYAIGLQEMVDLSAKNVLISGKLSDEKAREWAQLIKQCINKHAVSATGNSSSGKSQQTGQSPKGRYVEVAVQNMVGLCVLVFIREELRQQHVVEIGVSKLGIGIMGHGGNKGAVAVRFRIHDTSFCFVCTHLAAHRNNVEGRNKDVETILQKLHFVPKWAASSATRHNFESFRRRFSGGDDQEDDDDDVTSAAASGGTQRMYDVVQAAVSMDASQSQSKGSVPNSPDDDTGRKKLPPRRRRSSLKSMMEETPGLPTERRASFTVARRNSSGLFKLLRSGSTVGLSEGDEVEGGGDDSSSTHPSSGPRNETDANAGRAHGNGSEDRDKSEAADTDFGKKIAVLDHDIVFWFGDLNYRLQKKIQNEVAFAKIFDDTWQELLSIDQLNIERACNRVFAPFRGVNPHYGEGRGKMQSDSKLRRLEQNSNAMEKSLMKWTEGVPSFTPTYKYRPGTGKYDLRGTPWDPNSKGGKMRCPAWCDRILWRAPQDYVVQHTYKDCAALVHSDHRPVGTRLTVRTDQSQRLTPRVAVAARKGIDRLEKFLAALGRASPSSPRSLKTGTNSNTAAADDELSREEELKYFARNISLVVLKPSELRAELELAQASVIWAWRVPACLAQIEDLLRDSVQYKVDYIPKYKQAQVTIASAFSAFFKSTAVNVDLLLDEKDNANDQENPSEKESRAALGSTDSWRQSRAFIVEKIAHLRASVECGKKCSQGLDFLAASFEKASEDLRRAVQAAKTLLNIDFIAEPESDKFLDAIHDVFLEFWSDFGTARKLFTDKVASLDKASAQSADKLSGLVDEKYSAITVSSQELQHCQTQLHLADTAAAKGKETLLREHNTVFDDCKPNISSILIHREDFKAQLMEEAREKIPIKWKSNNRLIKKQGKHMYLFTIPSHLRESFGAAHIHEGDQVLAVEGISCVGVPYKDIISNIERMYLNDDDPFRALKQKSSANARKVTASDIRLLEFSFGSRETAARDAVWLSIDHSQKLHTRHLQRIEEINASHDDLVADLITTLKKAERELRIVSGRRTRQIKSSWDVLVNTLFKMIPKYEDKIADQIRSFEQYDTKDRIQRFIDADAVMCDLVGFPNKVLSRVATASPRSTLKFAPPQDANSYSYPLRQPLIFQAHYNGLSSVRFLLDRLKDTGTQLKRLRDYFLARVASTQQFLKKIDACCLARRNLLEGGFGDGGKLGSPHFPKVSKVFHWYHQLRLCTTGYEHLGYSQAALKISHLMETLTKALETFDLHLVSIQREFCDKQSKYARALQQRHIAQRKAADEGGLVHKSSTNLDDFEYFEYLNAQEVQDLCAKQLMEHVQRYEVFWRIKLEAIIKTDLLAVLITGADADTLAKTTTARPEVPRFDMGTPKDEDKGSDEPDRKVKISKRAAAVNDEEFLQAQALYECAVARSEQMETLQLHVDSLIECEQAHVTELEELLQNRGPLENIRFSFSLQSQANKCFFKLYLQRLDAWNREQLEGRKSVLRRLTRCSVQIQDASPISVVETYKDNLSSPDDYLPMMAQIAKRISQHLSTTDEKTLTFVNAFSESVTAFQKVVFAGMARRRAAALLRAHGHSRLNENLLRLAVAASKHGSCQENTNVSGPCRFADQRLSKAFCGYIESQLTSVREIICHGLVTKTVGASAKQRVLVLTSTPHLVYMVPDTGEIKGDIDWSETIYAKLVEGTSGHFKVCTPDRTFNLSADDGETCATDWVIRINNLAISKYGSLKPEAVDGGRLQARFRKWQSFALGEEATLSV